jgi:ketosteroid isomerase-like protein
MKTTLQRLLLGLLLCTGLRVTVTSATTPDGAGAASNKAAVQAAFDAWRAGTGGPFALLAPDATWTITGNSIAAKTYTSRDAFINEVIKPFNARLSKPLVPTMRGLYEDGNTVIALFDGEALALDGKPYRNTYAWFMEMHEGRIVKVTAFFDAPAFDDFWKRVAPRPVP